MSNVQEELWDALSEMTGEEVLRHLTNYHGLQLLDDGFREHLVDEGVIPENEDCEESISEYASDDFDTFCMMHPTCITCPLFRYDGDCKEGWKKLKKASEKE